MFCHSVLYACPGCNFQYELTELQILKPKGIALNVISNMRIREAQNSSNGNAISNIELNRKRTFTMPKHTVI